ncbi:unnamed protein product [Ectocarpus sp. 4 AP-2014]
MRKPADRSKERCPRRAHNHPSLSAVAPPLGSGAMELLKLVYVVGRLRVLAQLRYHPPTLHIFTLAPHGMWLIPTTTRSSWCALVLQQNKSEAKQSPHTYLSSPLQDSRPSMHVVLHRSLVHVFSATAVAVIVLMYAWYRRLHNKQQVEGAPWGSCGGRSNHL